MKPSKANSRTDKNKANFLVAFLECSCNISETCKQIGISRKCYYLWCENDKPFAESVDEILEARVDFVEGKLLQLITAGDVASIIFFLKTKGKHRGYAERFEIQEIKEQPLFPDLGSNAEDIASEDVN